MGVETPPPPRVPLSLPPCEDTGKDGCLCTKSAGPLILNFPAIKIVRNQCRLRENPRPPPPQSVVFWSPNILRLQGFLVRLSVSNGLMEEAQGAS